MCGIFGVIVNKRSDTNRLADITRELFLLSESRGKEASGFAYADRDRIRIFRTPRKAHEIVREPAFIDALSSITAGHWGYGYALIGHSRLATNGSAYQDKNNQPVIGKETVLTHNGILINDRLLWKKYIAKKKIPQLDTAVLAAVLDHHLDKTDYDIPTALHHVYRESEGEMSIAFLARRSRSLFLATNTGSIYYAHTQSGIFLFSSERFITQTVLQSMKDEGRAIQLHAGQTAEVPFNTLGVRVFDNKKSPKSSTGNGVVHYDISRIGSPVTFTHAQNLFRNSLRQLQAHEPNYSAIERIPRCIRCILPATMPLIEFDAEGVCNFCREYVIQQPKGREVLESVVTPFRGNTNQANCIVALSGGRDSSYGLHYTKKILGLMPMAYTYDWGMVTDVARRNQSRMVSALGVEHIWVSADIDMKRRNIRKNVEAWLAKPDIAMVPLFMAGDKQAEYFAEELKRKTGINLIIYCRGNQLEDERFKFGYYGIFDGTPRGVLHNLSWSGKLTMASYFLKAAAANPRYINSSLLDTAGAYTSSYLMPHNFLYLWHYIPWNEQKIVSTLINIYGWEKAKDTIATWRIDDGTPPFYNYIYYQVQGFTEHDGLRSNQIREGHISRNEALRLVKEENKPRYESLQWYFDIIGIDGHKALSVVDRIPKKYARNG